MPSPAFSFCVWWSYINKISHAYAQEKSNQKKTSLCPNATVWNEKDCKDINKKAYFQIKLRVYIQKNPLYISHIKGINNIIIYCSYTHA